MLDHSDFVHTDRLIDIVRQVLAKRSIDRPIAVDDNLRQVGLTSLDMVGLMLTIESEFDVQIPDAEMTPANFSSISKIAAIITALLAKE